MFSFGTVLTTLLYFTVNLYGLNLSCEPNPGGILHTDANLSDVAVSYRYNYGELISNVNKRPIWANAFLVKKIVDTLPDGSALRPFKGYLEWETKCPALPKRDVNQIRNAEQADCSILFYDGSGKFGGPKTRCEAALMWKLNPWSSDYGKIMVRIDNDQWFDTGFTINPDLNWHKFRIECDFSRRLVTKVVIDGRSKNLSIPMWVHTQPEWGPETAVWADIDTSSTYPVGDDGVFRVFWWSQYFRNYKWGIIQIDPG